MKNLRRALNFFAVLAAAILAAAWFTGTSLMEPSRHAVNPPPKDLPCTPVSFKSSSGAEIKGWYVPVADAHKAVLLLHGSGGDRTSMLDYARFLRAAGYATLLIDFRAHGESTGDTRTFGWYESKDAISAVAWMKQRLPGAKVAVIGTSLGGASALLAKDALHADAIIAQSVYGNLREAIWNRVDMRCGTWAANAFSCLLTFQVPLRLGLDIDEVSPAKAAAFTSCPVFVIHGTEDRHAHLVEGRAIFDACPSPQKQWWAVPGAGHVDLCTYAGDEYRNRVLAFLDGALK